nr:MAG TPA: hypothetical protein [Caudoviricetes sp.]
MINLGNTGNWESDLLHEYLEWDRRKGRITVEKIDMIVQTREQLELMIDEMRAFRALVSFILVTWINPNIILLMVHPIRRFSIGS